jgi:integrase/recombinase XerD
MLDRIFRSPKVVARLRNGPLAEILEGFAGYLSLRGNARITIQEYVRSAAHLAHWLSVEAIPPKKLAQETVDRFLDEHVPRCRCVVTIGSVHHARFALGHLLCFLRDTGQIPPAPKGSPSAVDLAIAEYEGHLVGTRGAMPQTCRWYLRYVREFLGSSGVLRRGLAGLGVGQVMDFVATRARQCKPGTAKLVATALRSFLRFEQMRGRCDARSAQAVPTIPRWRLGQIPKTLTEEQTRTLLGSFDHSTAIGKRDYAMAICLVRLALRAGEVAQLSLDDIDWRGGTLKIAMSKSRRASLLPLPSQVGQAIVAYLRGGRPATTERRIFVCHGFPVGRSINSGVVRSAIRRAFERARVAVPSKGTHALRHTAATAMVRAGASMKEVADILGHRSINTTAIYAKVDLPRLRAVALPFPKVLP